MGENENKHARELELIKRVASQCKNAVVTGPAGARWVGLSTLQWVTNVDLALPGNSREWGKRYTDRTYRSGVMRPHEFNVDNGVRVAKGIRSIFDSYRYHGRMEALVQLESALWKFPRLTTQTLLEQSQMLPRARGTKEFRQLIEYAADTSASALETIRRDQILRAIDTGELKGVRTLEFQVGFNISDLDGSPTTAWADALLNGFLFVESDGLVKKDGTFGDPVYATLRERHREVEMQNRGAVFIRTPWNQTEDSFIARLQRQLQLHPGVRELPNRRPQTYREFLEEMQRRASW